MLVTQDEIDEYLTSGLIRSNLWTEAILQTGNGQPIAWCKTLLAEMARVEEVGKRWEREVWFGGQRPDLDDARTESHPDHPEWRQYKEKPEGHGSHFSTREDVLPEGSLQARVVPALVRGLRAEVDDRVYLTYSMAGRCIFQAEYSTTGRFVSFIMDETTPSPRGGIRSITARSDEAIALLTNAIEDWKAGRMRPEPASSVGFGF